MTNTPEPKKDDEAKAEPEATPADPPAASATDWVSSKKEVREAAKWLATTLGAVAGIIFGAGPLLARTDFDYSDDITRALLAVLFAIIGAVAATVTIGLLVDVITPTRVSLDELPAKLFEDLSGDPDWFLAGEDVSTVDQMLTLLAGFRRIAANLERDIRYESDAKKKKALEAQLVGVRENVENFEAARTELLEIAAFEKVSRSFSGGRRVVLLACPVIVVAAGAAYLLTLSGKVPEKKEATRSSEASIGTLSPIGANGDAWWEALDLADCETGSNERQIAVLVTGGDGSVGKPFTVETLGEPTQSCRRTAFTVDPNVGLVKTVEPTAVKVELVEPTTTTTEG